MDSILYWNDVALEANRVSHTNGLGEQTGPPLSARALAIVHLAMYDAYAGVNKTAGLSAYLPGLPPAPGTATTDAAVAAAAHATLVALFPGQRAFFDAKLAGAGGALGPGHQFGVIVASALLADRADDPGAGAVGYVPSQARFHHRPDPDNPHQGYHAPFYGDRARCFAVTTRHALDDPFANTNEYVAALREVRAKGIAPAQIASVPAGGVAPRTPLETLIGLFWGYDGAAGLGTPPRLYNQIVRRLAIARGNTEAQNARLFALINVAMADAGILAWEQKYRYDLWRPVIGVREEDPSLGMASVAGSGLSADCDPEWLPLGAPATNSTHKNFTPPFPAYPSGHATFGAAALHSARLFYGIAPNDRAADTLFSGLDFISEELNGVNQDNHGVVRSRHARAFPDGLWQMIIENGRSRVYLGVHWVFDAFAVDATGAPDLTRNVGGVRLGVDIAEDIFASGMDRSNV